MPVSSYRFTVEKYNTPNAMAQRIQDARKVEDQGPEVKRCIEEPKAVNGYQLSVYGLKTANCEPETVNEKKSVCVHGQFKFGESIMKKNAITLLSTLVFLCCLFFSVQTVIAAESTIATPKKMPAQSEKAAYRIGCGDILEITTWKEPDFSREEILVRIDGKISFPLLTDIQAAGRTPIEIKKDIETRLMEYIANPVVTVTVRNPESQKFYILGEVARTGEYNLVKNLTVLQAFALAGGFTEWASKKEIILFRTENGKEKIIRINYKDIIKGKNFSNNLEIQADDTIIVP